MARTNPRHRPGTPAGPAQPPSPPADTSSTEVAADSKDTDAVDASLALNLETEPEPLLATSSVQDVTLGSANADLSATANDNNNLHVAAATLFPVTLVSDASSVLAAVSEDNTSSIYLGQADILSAVEWHRFGSRNVLVLMNNSNANEREEATLVYFAMISHQGFWMGPGASGKSNVTM